ncbi:hypothetical protein MRCP2_p3880 (plasmid) [Aquipseudomonas alcaligenes]|nr:hypothetical protein MRCP2_p3880 [Pseudomonas alcaligenes]
MCRKLKQVDQLLEGRAPCHRALLDLFGKLEGELDYVDGDCSRQSCTSCGRYRDCGQSWRDHLGGKRGQIELFACENSVTMTTQSPSDIYR